MDEFEYYTYSLASHLGNLVGPKDTKKIGGETFYYYTEVDISFGKGDNIEIAGIKGHWLPEDILGHLVKHIIKGTIIMVYR